MSPQDSGAGEGRSRGDVEIERLETRVALLVPSSGMAGDRLHEALAARVENLLVDGVNGFVVDLRSYPMLDSSGLGALIACHGAADNGGAKLVLTGVRPSLHRTLSRAMLLQVMPVYETVERALVALRS